MSGSASQGHNLNFGLEDGINIFPPGHECHTEYLPVQAEIARQIAQQQAQNAFFQPPITPDSNAMPEPTVDQTPQDYQPQGSTSQSTY